MFSGIIEELGKVSGLKRKPDGGGRLTIEVGALKSECAIGDSIAVNGVCLTIESIDGDVLDFDLSEETLRVTDLGRLKAGDPINLELALRLGERLGGHFVSGHIDEVGRIMKRRVEGDCSIFEISASDKTLKLIIDRGSIAVDGISLTVTKIFRAAFELVIIPHTVKMTTLGSKAEGDVVNLEADLIGKHIARLVEMEAGDKVKNTQEPFDVI